MQPSPRGVGGRRGQAGHRPAGEADRALNPTIFHETWWLDHASDGTWQEVTVESGGALAARLPFVPDRKFTGQLSLVMPRLTRCLGPAIAGSEPADSCLKLPRRRKLTAELIARLPRASHVWLQLHRGVTDTLAFEDAGFAASVRFTTEIAPAGEQQLWAAMRDKTRNVIRRAQEAHAVTQDMTAPPFLAFYAEAAREHGRANAYPAATCGALLGEALARGRGRVHAALDAAGDPQAAILTVEDGGAVYYLMSARRRQAGNGAVSLLLWTALRSASARGLIFDTDGISGENQLLLSGLGGQIRPRFVVSQTSALHSVQRAASDLIHRLRR